MNILKITSAATILILSTSANAALVQRLGGLAVYDDVANLTWLADANAAGSMNWADANTWAAGLSVAGVTGWRLPETPQLDASCSGQFGGIVSFGVNCTGSEIGNLFYNVLGGSASKSITTKHNVNYALFNNLQSGKYWSATDYALKTQYAWLFFASSGLQLNDRKSSSLYALAVHSGDVSAVEPQDVSAVPVPAAVWLFGSGLIGLAGLGRRKTVVSAK